MFAAANEKKVAEYRSRGGEGNVDARALVKQIFRDGHL